MEQLNDYDGDNWNILSKGASRDGKTFCHLASTTKGRHQRNGFCPLQICTWIEDERLALSLAMQREENQRRDYISAYYADRANSGQAALTTLSA